jgi:hypothetical protein
VTLPNYILRRYSEPGGVRLAKRVELVPVAGVCPVCHLNIIWRKFNGTEQVDGVWQNEQYYHYVCRPRPESYVEYGPPSRRDDDKVPQGNLDNEEYRYWIGTSERDYLFAMCRACRKSKYGKLERQQHFKDPDFLVNGDPCTTRLVKAYKKLMDSTLCLVCKEKRWGRSRWGVPLCESSECIRKWKFSQDEYLALKFQLELQVKKSDFLKRKAEGKEPLVIPPPRMGEFVILPNDKPTNRSYCHHCNMFTDAPAHTEIHMHAVMKGEIYED